MALTVRRNSRSRCTAYNIAATLISVRPDAIGDRRRPVEVLAAGTIAFAIAFVASSVAGLLWTLVSPAAAFIYAATWMLIALEAFAVGEQSVARFPCAKRPHGH